MEEPLAPEPDGFAECDTLFRMTWEPLYITGAGDAKRPREIAYRRVGRGAHRHLGNQRPPRIKVEAMRRRVDHHLRHIWREQRSDGAALRAVATVVEETSHGN